MPKLVRDLEIRAPFKSLSTSKTSRQKFRDLHKEADPETPESILCGEHFRSVHSSRTPVEGVAFPFLYWYGFPSRSLEIYSGTWMAMPSTAAPFFKWTSPNTDKLAWAWMDKNDFATSGSLLQLRLSKLHAAHPNMNVGLKC